MAQLKHQHRQQRKKRIRAKVFGTAERPRLTVYCSLTKVTAQLVDDVESKTLAFATSKPGKKTVKDATAVGETIAAAAKKLSITSIVFDRNGRKYHGRVKALAEAVRAAGLQF
ncbi:MAG: 50S ribosomal protein L18 [Candidatus Peribacteraceae bacterium]